MNIYNLKKKKNNLKEKIIKQADNIYTQLLKNNIYYP